MPSSLASLASLRPLPFVGLLTISACQVAACSDIFPPVDAGSGTDASTSDAATQDTTASCVQNYGECYSTSVCCSASFYCNASGICSAMCLAMNTVCTDSSQCCSGICMGTCQ